MKARAAFRSEAGPVRMSKRQAGYTLVSTFVSFTIGGIILMGAWMAYRDMQVQLHVNNADRIMDQYAQAAIQELTNDLSWSWVGIQMQGGSRFTRWKFLMRDEMQENGTWNPWFRRDLQQFTQVRYTPTQGLLIGDQPPKWAEDRFRSQFVWTGRTPRSGESRAMDRRDRMTMESMIMDRPASTYETPGEEYKHNAAVQVQLTMQYRYKANSLLGLYSKEYVRERTYKTTIYQRNWYSDINEWRDILAEQAGHGGQGL